MTAEVTTIKSAYEEENLSPDFIAEDRGLDIVAVKAALMQSSSKYRKDCGMEEENEDNLNYSKDEQRRVKDAILDLGLSSEDEHLRFKALTYIRDDAKGRRDTVKGIAGSNFNIMVINEILQKGKNAAERIKQSVMSNGHSEQKAINV